MKKILIVTVAALISASFITGVYCSAVRHLPVNPDVLSTMNQLKRGMNIDEVIPLVSMSFVLERKSISNRQEIVKYFGDDIDVVTMVRGSVPALAIGYDVRLGFSNSGELVAVNYVSNHGWAWPFYLECKPHSWTPSADSGLRAYGRPQEAK